MDKILNNDMSSSLKEAIKKKITSSVYGTFIIEDKIFSTSGMLKNDYLKDKFFNVSDWDFWAFLILPFLFTYLTIWTLHKYIFFPFYKKERENRDREESFNLIRDKELEKLRTEVEEQTLKKLNVVVRQKEGESKIKKVDPTIEWEKEYEVFKETSYFNNFPMLIESIYQHDGEIQWHTGTFMLKLPQNLLAYAHTNDLIGITDNSINLTNKGKFFVKKYYEK